MPLIDSHGRVFGRFNLVDALLVLLVIVALPLAYASRVLFRDPPPRLTLVAPKVLNQGADRLIELTGEHFRPYMRVSFGTTQAPSFQFYGPRQAFVPMPALEPGTYDVVLYDHEGEVARLAQVLTVVGPVRPPRITLRIRGAYTGVSAEHAGLLIAGRPMNATEGVIGQIESRDEPRAAVARVRVSDALTVPVAMEGLLEVPATILVTCPTSVGPGGVLRCATSGVTFAPDMHISFEGPSGLLLFRIDGIDPTGTAVK